MDKLEKYCKYKLIFNELLETMIKISNAEEHHFKYGIWFLEHNYDVCYYEQTKQIAIECSKKINEIIDKPIEIIENIEECNKNFDLLEKKTDILYKPLQEIINSEEYYLREGFDYPYKVVDASETKHVASNAVQLLKEFSSIA